MSSSRALSAAFWALAGLIVLLFTFDALFVPETHPYNTYRYGKQSEPRHAAFIQDPSIPLARSVPIITRHSPGHQNPAVAPPQPIEQVVKVSTDDTFNSTVGSTPVTNSSQHGSSLVKRDGGPLYCKNGPCIDGSCCGKNSICGYGPDYCGDGCQSQCTATAMCGKFSENAEMPCGMNLCCSATGWCGTTSDYCNNADPAHGTLPCQAGYGSCQTYSTPSCAAGSGSTSKRRIGYYQSWNVRERKCNTVQPKDLDTVTSLYTHLFYAFASIDPNTFAITNAHPDDEKMIPNFTALKSDKLQTWIAVGGFDFSNKGPTHTTWSDLCASKTNRATFISSVKAYMDKYGFQGIDLDWEYPGAPERGGNKLADVRNFPLLVREMRAAFGTSYGISVTLAPDYWYLRWFDAKAMEASVDFFGFMAYDLHGYWDQDVLTLGKVVRGQADIREISTDTMPLWFDGLDPGKINFGLAMYGRGYTLSDASCNTLGCSFAGPSKPGQCTGFDGVLSLWEIKDMIKNKGYKSTYLPDAMMKQLTFDDQWIGYDDEETFAAKKAWADSRCFGGSMVWGIDYGVGGSGSPQDDYPVVYLDPTVYSQVPAQCTPPCLLVFPPSSLPTPTTISIPLYTTSLQIAPGTTTTITITPPALTVTSMSYFNMIISSGQDTASTTITPYLSANVPHVTTVVGGQTRTLTLPPWPLITNGPPDHSENTTPGSPSQTTSTTVAAITMASAAGSDAPEPTVSDISKTEYSGTRPTTVFPWPSTVAIAPIQTPVPDEGEDDDGDGPHWKSSCKLWFFWVCIELPAPFNIEIQGWNWNLPVGTWGPGIAPPGIEWPPDMTLKGTLPPWPKITVHPGGKIEPEEKPKDCTPKEASLCITKSYFATTVQAGVTRTTDTSTTETCATITGCDLKDVATTVAGDVCTLRRREVIVTELPEPTETLTPAVKHLARRSHQEPKVHLAVRAEPDWSCEQPGLNGIVWPRNGENLVQVQQIRDILQRRQNALGLGWDEVRAKDLGFTAFFLVFNMGPAATAYFNSKELELSVRWAYHPENPIGPSSPRPNKRGLDTSVPKHNNRTHPLLKRGNIQVDSSAAWHLSMVSWPNNGFFNNPYAAYHNHNPAQNNYATSWDASRGAGQTVYIVESGMPSDTEYNAGMRELSATIFGAYTPTQVDEEHGALVAALAVGQSLGIARNANRVFVKNPISGLPLERFLEVLVNIADDAARIPVNTCVVNMSFGTKQTAAVEEGLWKIQSQLMRRMTEKYGCVFVAAPGNDGNVATYYPALSAPNVPGMLVVCAVDKDGKPFTGNTGWNLCNAMAPGVDIPAPGITAVSTTGTSYASPMVAGLVAYFRGLPTDMYAGNRDPVSIARHIQKLARPIPLVAPGQTSGYRIIWNGLVGDTVCPSSQSKRSLELSQDSPSCGFNNGADGSNQPRPRGPAVPFHPGPPGPICSASCGTLCDGYYCNVTGTPTGTPPDFTSPVVTTTLPPLTNTTSVSYPTTPTATIIPDWSRPSGFPPPSDTTNMTYSCSNSGNHLNFATCDYAATQFFQGHPDTVYWATRDGNRQVCVNKTDNNPESAGCMIQLMLIDKDAPAQDTRCGFSGTLGLQWYTNLMSKNCGKSAWLESKEGCRMTVLAESLCADT